MHITLRKYFLSPNCSLYVISLAFFSTFGLLFGILLGQGSQDYLSLMRMVPVTRVSIVGLIATVLLPVFVSTAAYFSHYAVNRYICAFVRSVFSGLLVSALSCIYGPASWLINTFLISYWVCSLMWFWLCFQDRNSTLRIKCLFATVHATVCSVVGIFDFLLVSPFLSSLMVTIT